ncbi:MAG TPA: hypothetical protein VLU73_11700 [Methylococcaceae bacterium]|jgi:hypothetical protein|nr:hypothetical protein [Methylococcaceae bacterium]
MDAFDLWRFTHPDGSSKDWAIRRNADGSIITRWGPTGPTLPQISTRRQDKIALENAKRRKGYVHVGQVLIEADGRIRSIKDGKGEVLPDETIVKEDAVYWRLHLVDLQDAWNGLQRAIAQLHSRILLIEPDFDGDTWDGWPLPKPDRDRSGIIKPEGKAGIKPVLFLMALQKLTLGLPLGVRVSLATEDGIEIGHDLRNETAVLTLFGTDMEAVRPLAEVLGLLQPKINLAEAIVSDHDSWF